MKRTLATFVRPGSFLSPAEQSNPAATILVGRKVANTSFIHALLRYGSFDRYCFFVGENGDLRAVQHLIDGGDPTLKDRITVLNMLELPDALAHGMVSVLHQNSHIDQIGTLVALRDRYAKRAVPVTSQIHSLSYPSMMESYASICLAQPSEIDAVFCSSEPGREVVERCMASALEGMATQGLKPQPPRWQLPVVPLGIDCSSLEGGNRQAMRRELGIPDDAFVVLSIARFTEFDKMDIFPLLSAFTNFKSAVAKGKRKPFLLLAGARQGTQTPQMVRLWAKARGLEDHVRFRIDFSNAEKASLLAAADVFIAPSDNPQETFGITVIEAMAAGLPIIAADLDGYRDTVSKDVGLRVATHWNSDAERLSSVGALLYQRPLHLFLAQGIEVDIKEMAAAMTLLYHDDPTRMRMATAARARARALYDWSKVIPRYQKVWDTLMEGPFTPQPHKRHPLLMDFQRVFGHYTTTVRETARTVRRSALSRACCNETNVYPVYPELHNLFDNNGVMAALQLAESPVSIVRLEAALQARLYSRTPWRASMLVGWLIKHGLLERC